MSRYFPPDIHSFGQFRFFNLYFSILSSFICFPSLPCPCHSFGQFQFSNLYLLPISHSSASPFLFCSCPSVYQFLFSNSIIPSFTYISNPFVLHLFPLASLFSVLQQQIFDSLTQSFFSCLLLLTSPFIFLPSRPCTCHSSGQFQLSNLISRFLSYLIFPTPIDSLVSLHFSCSSGASLPLSLSYLSLRSFSLSFMRLVSRFLLLIYSPISPCHNLIFLLSHPCHYSDGLVLPAV